MKKFFAKSKPLPQPPKAQIIQEDRSCPTTPDSLYGDEEDKHDHKGNLVDCHNQRLFPVKKVVGRRVKRGKKEYLVGWKDYPSSQNSWEPKSILSDNKEERLSLSLCGAHVIVAD